MPGNDVKTAGHRCLTRGLQQPGCGWEPSGINHSLLGNIRVSSFNPSADLPMTRTTAMNFSSRLWSSGRAWIVPVLLTQPAACIPGVVRAEQGCRQAEAPACWGCGSATTVCRASSGTPALGAQVTAAAQPATHALCSGYAQRRWTALAMPWLSQESSGKCRECRRGPKLKVRILKTPLQLLPHLQVQAKDWWLRSFLTQVLKSRVWLPSFTLAICFTRRVH